ncbi:hypothetical protein F9K50_03840 [bacterium]|nr:MAG: hypothetical protein F9K50_03840 [bacterium]
MRGISGIFATLVLVSLLRPGSGGIPLPRSYGPVGLLAKKKLVRTKI